MPLARSLRIVIPGGTGYLGVLLARHFYEQGHSVSAITRFPKPRDWEAVHWDAKHLGDWVSSLEGADVVINLAGRSTRCRPTKRNRDEIKLSRIRTTKLIGDAISRCSRPPGLWLNASSIDIYPEAREVELDEFSMPETREQSSSTKVEFSTDMTRSWEDVALACPTPNTRKVLLRQAQVMSPDRGGTFDHLLRLVRWGFGGEVGNGEQFVAWIHDFDFIRAVEFLIENEQIEGAVNVTAPVPLANHEFMCNLRRAWCTSYFGMPAPAWLVEVISFTFRTNPEQVLKSRRILPHRLLEGGFSFHFPQWRGACENLVARWRAAESA